MVTTEKTEQMEKLLRETILECAGILESNNAIIRKDMDRVANEPYIRDLERVRKICHDNWQIGIAVKRLGRIRNALGKVQYCKNKQEQGYY
jgi:hypothetical protein